MGKRSLVVAGGVAVFVGIMVACGVESVQAQDYRQGCSTAADCVLVDQLIDVPGTNVCTVPCKGAINKDDLDKYNEEYTQEHHDCSKIHPSSCAAGTQVAACVSGTCTQGFQLDDGGVIFEAGTD